MLKKIKSLFIVEDENSKAAQANQSTKENPGKKTAKDIKVSKPQYDASNPPKGKVDEKFVNRLLGAIEEHNIDGFDYIEFKQALTNLGNVQMDEGTKFKSALAMAQTMGAKKEVLISSANHYLQVLSNEESKFLEAFKNQLSRQVNTRNDEIKSLENGIALKKKQMAQLENEITESTKKLEQKKASITQANAKVESTKDSFYHAYHIVTNQIKDDLNKMKQFL